MMYSGVITGNGMTRKPVAYGYRGLPGDLPWQGFFLKMHKYQKLKMIYLGITINFLYFCA